MLTQQVTKKKKKVKSRDRQPASQKVRVLARPNQPLGTSFEYDMAAHAMRVTEFVSSDSVVSRGGVQVGMYLTEVDDLSVVGLKQDDVVFMLQRKAGSLRELLFESLSLKLAVTSDQNGTGSTLRSHSASNDRVNLFPSSPQSTPPSTNKAPLKHVDSQELPVVRSPTSSNAPLQAHTPLQPPPRRRKSQELKKAITSASQTSYSHMMKHGTASSSPLPTAGRSSAAAGLRPDADPFSTPARRRRLVADVARFLLKQYCIQACTLVHDSRVRYRAATIIQCLFRCYRARRCFRKLMFLKHTAAATRIQALFRRLAAESLLRALRAEHRVKLATHLALCLQCLSRVRTSREVVAKERQVQTAVAVGVQRLLRGKWGRNRATQRKRELERRRRAREAAAIRLQCQHRRRIAERVLEKLRQVYELEMCMSSRIALRWRRRCRRRREAAINLQRVVRGWRGRKKAATEAHRQEILRREELRRKAEERAMGLEDHRATLLRAQHRVEIRVDLSPSLLSSLKRCKIATLIKWCVEQSVLQYDNDEGGSYAMGDVIRQVLSATHTPSDVHLTTKPNKNAALGNKHRARHVELQNEEASTASENKKGKDASLAIKQSGDEKQAIQLPTSAQGFPQQFNRRYTLLPSADPSQVHTHKGRPLTLRISSPQEGGCVCMHLEPVFRSFLIESERLHRNQRRTGAGAPIDNPLSCPNLSTCDVHIILGTDTSSSNDNNTSPRSLSKPDVRRDGKNSNPESAHSLDSKYVGVDGHEVSNQLNADSDEEEMLKFRFKDVSVSVSVTTIVDGDDTTECLVNTKKKREAEEAERVEKERQAKAKELADLEATKALVAEINAAAAEKERLEKEKKRIELEAARRAEKEAADLAAAAAAAAAAAKSKEGKRSRPTTATKRIKVSVIDEDAREKELLRKRLAEEEAERQRRLEAERQAAEKVRLARLRAIREKAAAECIQRTYRAYVLFKEQTAAAIKLQRCVRRWIILRRWFRTVLRVLGRGHFAAISLQKRFRGHQGREAVLLKRLDACSNDDLQRADHWMNVQILRDYRFALGRSFISEGKVGYVIGGPSDNDETEVDGESLLVSDEDDSDEDEEDEDDDEDGSSGESSDEEDYIINQRLNKHKNTKSDMANAEAFVNQLFSIPLPCSNTDAVTDTSALKPSGPAASAVCYCSREDILSLRPQSQSQSQIKNQNKSKNKSKSQDTLPPSLKGGAQWAAELMSLLEFPPSPPLCVSAKSRPVLLHLPLPPPAPLPQSGGVAPPSSAVITALEEMEGSLGNLCSPSDPRLGTTVKSVIGSSDAHHLSSEMEIIPPIYSMNCTFANTSSGTDST